MKALKAVSIIIVFGMAMVALLAVKGQSGSGKLLHEVIFLETVEDWGKCELDGSEVNIDSAAVVFDNRKGTSRLATYPVGPGFKFDQLILSWNIRYMDRPGSYNFSVEVSGDGKAWHRFDYLSWGDSSSFDKAGEKSIEGVGRMEMDVLKLAKPMKFARVIVDFKGNKSAEKSFLRRLALSFSKDNPVWSDFKRYHPGKEDIYYGGVRLSVPYISQRSLEANKDGGACSPTSVSMVLNYHIPGIDPEMVARRAFDAENGIFGNWPFNVQAAFESGLSKTWADRQCGFDEIYYEVSNGKPVIISIAYDYDELPNSPIHSAENGHLVVVVGFDGPDSVICNDPAGHGVDDGIIKYPRKELEKAWVGHTGVVYHLWP
jgi:uncharacterized protein YvpB